jgi:hypothetical protein
MDIMAIFGVTTKIQSLLLDRLKLRHIDFDETNPVIKQSPKEFNAT